METIAACASAVGGLCAVLRLSGPRARAVAETAGLSVPPPWRVEGQSWRLAGGACPCRVLFAPQGRSFTGCDLIEVTLPGSRDLVELALHALIGAGASQAAPGAFSRQALANGRLSLPQAEAIHALATAPTEAAARLAVDRLRGALADDVARVREELLRLRAQIEASLDFMEEEDVRAFTPPALQQSIGELADTIARWIVAADSLGQEPVVALVGPANAGKSALFARLTGKPALVSPIAGTTRDWLDGTWMIGDRAVRLIDTAGWLDDLPSHLDRAALDAARKLLPGAALILACSAPDAPLPKDRQFERMLVVGTKCDLPGRDERAMVSVSAVTGAGLPQLADIVGEGFAATPAGEPRQQRLLGETAALLARLRRKIPADVLLAEDLRRAADLLGELIGATTPDDILDAIFSKFCIGK